MQVEKDKQIKQQKIELKELETSISEQLETHSNALVLINQLNSDNVRLN